MRGEGYSLSDIRAVTDGSNGFGGDFGAWWIIIIIILFGGWGRNGYGFGGSGSGANDNYVLTSDFAQLSRQLADSTAMTERKLDGVNNGLCSGFYQEAQLINGLDKTILTTGNTLGSQLADVGFSIKDCCCTTNRNIDQVRFDMSQNTLTLSNTMNMNTRDVIDNMNANYRALHDEIVANRIEDKNAQIAAQQNEINSLRLAASQTEQNAYLISQLRPCPIPAYPSCNPWGCNCNSGCGCNM